MLNNVCSSFSACRGCSGQEATFSVSLCEDAGTPVMGSSFVLSCAILHDGEIRRSDWALSEIINNGMSGADMAG